MNCRACKFYLNEVVKNTSITQKHRYPIENNIKNQLYIIVNKNKRSLSIRSNSELFSYSKMFAYQNLQVIFHSIKKHQYFALRLEKKSNTYFNQHCTGSLGQYMKKRKINLCYEDEKIEVKLSLFLVIWL